MVCINIGEKSKSIKIFGPDTLVKTQRLCFVFLNGQFFFQNVYDIFRRLHFDQDSFI